VNRVDGVCVFFIESSDEKLKHYILCQLL
jgi:hypothetical protein